MFAPLVIQATSTVSLRLTRKNLLLLLLLLLLLKLRVFQTRNTQGIDSWVDHQLSTLSKVSTQTGLLHLLLLLVLNAKFPLASPTTLVSSLQLGYVKGTTYLLWLLEGYYSSSRQVVLKNELRRIFYCDKTKTSLIGQLVVLLGSQQQSQNTTSKQHKIQHHSILKIILRYQHFTHSEIYVSIS